MEKHHYEHQMLQEYSVPDYLTEDYEREILTRDRSYCFPFTNLEYRNECVEDYQSLPARLNRERKSYYKYWDSFDGDTEESIRQLKEVTVELLPPLPECIPMIYEAIERLNPTKDLLDAVGQDIFTSIINSPDTEGDTVLHFAARQGSKLDWIAVKDCIKWPLNRAGRTAATEAYRTGDLHTWYDFIKLGAPIDFDALSNGNSCTRLIKAFAFESNKPQVFDWLGEENLKKWIEDLPPRVDCFNYLVNRLYGSNSKSLESLHSEILRLDNKDKYPCLHSLVYHWRVDINYVNDGDPPLTSSIMWKDWTDLGFILSYKPNPNISSASMYALTYVCSNHTQTNFYLPAIEALHLAGADMNIVDIDTHGRKVRPITLAVLSGKPIEPLMRLGARVDVEDDAGNTLLHILFRDSHQQLEGNRLSELLKQLVKHIDINKKNTLGRTALHNAIIYGHRTTHVSLLIELGADVNMPEDQLNRTPLLIGVWLSRLTVVEDLLKTGKVDVTSRDKLGKSVIDYALATKLNLGCIETIAVDSAQGIAFVDELKNYLSSRPDEALKASTMFVSHPWLVKFLLETVGFDVNMKGKENNSLISSIDYRNKHAQTVLDYLISKGANRAEGQFTKKLMRSLKRVTLTEEVFRERQLLIKNGAVLTERDESGLSAMDIDPLIETRYATEPSRALFSSSKKVSEAELITLRNDHRHQSYIMPLSQARAIDSPIKNITVPCACSISDVPIDVLGSTIFKFFDFHVWLKALVLVSKQWQTAARQSHVHKQLAFNIERTEDNTPKFTAYCEIVSKYGVNSLIVDDQEFLTPTSLFLLGSILKSSPKLHTVYFASSLNFADTCFPKIDDQIVEPPFTIENVITVAILCTDLLCLTLFPKAKQVKLIGDDRLELMGSVLSVKEVEVSELTETKLKSLVDVFPALSTIFVASYNPENSAEVLTRMKEIGTALGLTVISPPVLDPITPRAYAHVYDAYGYTLAGTGSNALKDNLFLTRTYEEDITDRQRQYRFPCFSDMFGVEPTEVWVDFKNLQKSGAILFDFWDTIEFEDDLTERLKLLASAKDHLPPKPSCVKALAELIEKHSPKEVLNAIGLDTFKSIINAADRDGDTVLHLTGQRLDWSEVKEFIEWRRNGSGYNAADRALLAGAFDQWHDLFQLGAPMDPNAHQEGTCTRLVSHFIQKGQAHVIDSIPSEYLKKLVLSCCYDVDEKQSFDWLIERLGGPMMTIGEGDSLFNAVLKQQNDNKYVFLDHLLQRYHVDINHIDASGHTPLMKILSQKASKWPELDFLLLRGANPNTAGAATMLPLTFLCSEDLTNEYFLHVLAALHLAGADMNIIDIDTHGRKVRPITLAVLSGKPIEPLIRLGARVDVEDDAGNTLLHALFSNADRCSYDQFKSAVKFLVKHIDVNKTNALGRTALHNAILNKYRVGILLKNGSDVNQAEGMLGRTPLMLASQKVMTKKLLATKNIDIKARDKLGQSIVDYFLSTNLVLEEREFNLICELYNTAENIEFVVNEIRRYFSKGERSYILAFRVLTLHESLARFLLETVGFDVNMKGKESISLISSIDYRNKHAQSVLDYLISKGANRAEGQFTKKLMRSLKRVTLTEEVFRERQLLIKNGAVLTERDESGLSAMDIDPLIETRYATDPSRALFSYDTPLSSDELKQLRLQQHRPAN